MDWKEDRTYVLKTLERVQGKTDTLDEKVDEVKDLVQNQNAKLVGRVSSIEAKVGIYSSLFGMASGLIAAWLKKHMPF